MSVRMQILSVKACGHKQNAEIRNKISAFTNTIQSGKEGSRFPYHTLIVVLGVFLQ